MGFFLLFFHRPVAVLFSPPTSLFFVLCFLYKHPISQPKESKVFVFAQPTMLPRYPNPLKAALLIYKYTKLESIPEERCSMQSLEYTPLESIPEGRVASFRLVVS